MKHFKKYVNKYIMSFLIAVFFLVLEALCDLLQPSIMAKIIDVGISNKDINYILLAGLIMIGITCLGGIFSIIRSIFATKVSQNFACDLRNDIFIKINNYSLKDIDKFTRASLITRTTNDISQIQHFVHGLMRVFIKSPIICIGSLIIVIKLDLKMSLIILVAIIIIFVVIILNMKLGYKFFKKVQKSTDNINSQIRQYLGGVKVVKLFGRFDYEVNKFENLNEELFINSSKATIMMSFFRPIITIVINLSIIIVLIIGGYSIKNGGLKIGVIVAYINYMGRILTSLIMISHILNVFVRAKASYERVVEVFDNSSSDNSNNKLDFISGDIEFKNVDFSYYKNKKTLKNISCKIKEGEHIGIIGQTGSGKTTFVNLILRLYDIDDGEIKIGNININDIDEKILRENIGIAFQKSSIFGKSIIENITLGNKMITRDMVIKSCDISCSKDFIEKMDNSYDEVLSQGGKSLSGGQRQRLTIARALAKKPKILIFDDCYSAMDINTENNIKNNIIEYIKELNNVDENFKCTLITVSQKINSIIDCDRIMVIENGNIAGFDKHENLLESTPIYKEIYKLQNGVKGGD